MFLSSGVGLNGMWIWVFQELLELLSSFLSLTYPFKKAKDSHLFYMVTCKRTTVHKQMQVNHHSSWFNAPIIYGSNHEESPSENSWNWVMKTGACCNIKRDTTARAHPFISIHSSYSKQHGSLYFSHPRSSKCLNYPGQMARSVCRDRLTC